MPFALRTCFLLGIDADFVESIKSLVYCEKNLVSFGGRVKNVKMIVNNEY